MAVANSGGSVIVDSSGVALAGFTNAAASNIKIQDSTIYTITANAIGSNATGAILLTKASGSVATLDSRHTFVCTSAQINAGTASDNPVSNMALSIKGAKLIFTGAATFSEATAPMIGDAQTQVIYRSTGSTWNSTHPGVNLNGSTLVFEAGGDGHLGRHPQATVKNVTLLWKSANPSAFVLGITQGWGSDNKPSSLDGYRFISVNGNNLVSAFTFNPTQLLPGNFPNNFFFVCRDWTYDVAAVGTQPTALRRSYRRVAATANAGSYWGAVSINATHLHIDLKTTLSASGVIDSTPTYLRTVDYNNAGTTASDTADDIVAYRFTPTVIDPTGNRLSNCSVVVTNTNANCSAANTIGNFRARLAASGLTNSNGQIVITEPTTKDYTSNASHRTDSIVIRNRTRAQAWHKWWESNTKLIPVSDSRNGTGTTAPEVYAANEFVVSYRRAGSVFSAVALDMTAPQVPSVTLSVDSNYNSASSTTGIVVTYSSGITSMALPNGYVSLDAMHKALVDFHSAAESNEAETVVPFSFTPGVFTYGGALNITGSPSAIIVAGSNIKTLSTTQTSAFNTGGNPAIQVPYIDALGARAQITGLDPEAFGVTWFVRYKIASGSTWTTISGTGDSAVILVGQETYSVQVRAPGYEWESELSLDTTVSLSLNAALRYHVSANNTPQYTMAYDATLEAIFNYDATAMKVSVANTTAGILQPGFAELYRATQRIQHIPALVWSWTAPVTANATSQKILIPAGNPISMYLTDASTNTVKITCPVIHADTGQSADDRVRGNATGYSIILGSPATAESAGLASQIISGLGGPSYDSAEHGLSVIKSDQDLAKAVLDLVKTAVDAIKPRTDLIPDQPAAVGSAMTLTSAYDAAKTAATQASVDALGTPLQATDYVAPANDDIASIKTTVEAIEPTDLSGIPGAVRTELATELARIDVAVSTRSTLTAGDIPAGLTAAQVWSAETRTLTETAGLTPTQAAQLNALTIDVDALGLAVDAVGEAVADVPAAVRTELTPELARIDAAVSTRSTLTAQDIPEGLTAAEVWAATSRTLTETPGLPSTQAEQLRKVAQLHGVGVPLVVTETSRTAGDVQQTLTTDEAGNTTVSAA